MYLLVSLLSPPSIVSLSTLACTVETDDPTSGWVCASYCWVKQLAIQFDKMDPTKFRDIPLPQERSANDSPLDKKAENVRQEEVGKTILNMVDDIILNYYEQKEQDTTVAQQELCMSVA